MGETIKELCNWLTRPTVFSLLAVLALVLALRFRQQVARRRTIVLVFALGGAFLAFALGDANFRRIVTKGDNLPILLLLAAVVFFTWLALRRMVAGDRRLAQGLATPGGEGSKEKVLVWPDLVQIELICLILVTVFLIAWSILVPAPIEQPAAQGVTPNPSKAPWYFLGLQELLVYFDPWIAGVLLPGFIIVGLCAIPYLDRNPRGSGYFTFAQRPFAVSFFLTGFLVFWVSLIVLGTFLRGPNWSFFGPFEPWDIHKLEPVVSVDLSTLFWVGLFERPRPESPWLRELPGILFLLSFFLLLPVLLARTWFRGPYREMGFLRYNVMMQMLLWFTLLPIKMGLRWTLGLKYIVSLHEHSFNI